MDVGRVLQTLTAFVRPMPNTSMRFLGLGNSDLWVRDMLSLSLILSGCSRVVVVPLT